MATQRLPDYVDQEEGGRHFGGAGRVAARVLGWLALGLWLGGQLTVGYFVEPAAYLVEQLAPVIPHHAEWVIGSTAYIFGLVSDRVNEMAFFCVLVLAMTCTIEARVTSLPRYLAYAPAAALIGAAFCLAAGVQVRWYAGVYGSSLTDAYGMYQRYAAAQMFLLIVIAVLLAWMQTMQQTSPEVLE